MATTRLYLDCRSKAKDGKGNVIITLFHNHSTAAFPTGVRVLPSQWNGSKIVKHPMADTLNTIINDKKLKVEKLIALLLLEDKFYSLTASEVKAQISNGTRKDTGHLISNVFEEYMSRDIKEGTRDIYRATLKKILTLWGNTKIESIDLKKVYQFERYLAETQGVNGRAIFLRSFKAVCKYAVRMHMIPSCPFDGFQIKSEPTRKRSIPVEKFREFLRFETTAVNDKYRDYFFLSFLLIGINVKDLLIAKHSQITGGRLEYIREKTHKFYSIKIEPEAQALIDKYVGEKYLLKPMDTCKSYRSFAREINEGCQSIGPTVEIMDDIFGETRKVIDPIIPGITTYFARHSWATFAIQLGIPIDVISMALGHSFGNPTTWIYIKQDRNRVDLANRAVIDYVLGSNSSLSSLGLDKSQALSPG